MGPRWWRSPACRSEGPPLLECAPGLRAVFAPCCEEVSVDAGLSRWVSQRLSDSPRLRHLQHSNAQSTAGSDA